MFLAQERRAPRKSSRSRALLRVHEALPRPISPLISHALREKRGTAFHRSAAPVISESSLKKPRLRSLLMPQFTGGDW